MIPRPLTVFCAGLALATAAQAADPWKKPASADASGLLPAESAFQFVSAQRDGAVIRVDWLIAPGYYLYRQRLAFEALPAPAKLAAAELPVGQTIRDEHFGTVEIYRDSLRATLPLAPGAAVPKQLRLRYQGCADAGVCYPPVTRVVDVAAAAP